MTTLSSLASTSSISTSTELHDAIASWANRGDLSSRLPQFVDLAEAKFNRRLRVRPMEATFATVDLTNGGATLPEGFLAFKELRYAGSPGWALEPRPLQWIRDQPAEATAPFYYAVADTEVICAPQVGSIAGTYYSAIPALRDNETNWLLLESPDLYLFACLEQVALYVRDKTLMDVAAAQTESLLQQIQGADNANAIGGGPLTVRAR
jgi:hypothetical protein